MGIAAAVFILAAVLWPGKVAENGAGMAAIDLESAEVEITGDELMDGTIEASPEQTENSEHREASQGADDGADLFGRVSPVEIEGAVYRRMAEQSGLKLTSLSSVECDLRTCKIAFSGVDANPQYTGEYSHLLGALTKPPWTDYRPTSGSIGTREISPGAREYVVGFTYVALVDTSDDMETAARQHAACAGAWARVTEQRGSDDYLRRAHEHSADWLERSASVLGMKVAQRLADELRYGPLTRDCHATPY